MRLAQRPYWNKEIKSKENWLEMFEEVPIEVEVYMTIRRVGMEAK